MKIFNQTTADDVIQYCARIGIDPLLVQGAGGNVSWKEGDVLWVKASGTWLAHAQQEAIFVSVDLAHLRDEMAQKNFALTPKVLKGSRLRPSIETLLHALMPQKIVVHLHAVDILARLVTANPLPDLKRLIPSTIPWGWIPYCKPGPELAEAVATCRAHHSDANVIFLQSHGVVIGADTLADIDQILCSLTQALRGEVRECPNKPDILVPPQVDGYVPFQDADLHQLAINKEYCDFLATKWALFPDHVVFLGPFPAVYGSFDEFSCARKFLQDLPELLFISGEGVYVRPYLSSQKTAQILCYFHVLQRQKHMTRLQPLSEHQIDELIDWEAERYRAQHLQLPRFPSNSSLNFSKYSS